MNDYFAEHAAEYITLRVAVGRCGISQGVLREAARLGRLQAVKLGRDWLTKQAWLDAYLQKYVAKPRK